MLGNKGRLSHELNTIFNRYGHIYKHTYIYTYIHAYIRTYIHTCIHKYIHTYIHIHTCIHTYIYNFLNCINNYTFPSSHQSTLTQFYTSLFCRGGATLRGQIKKGFTQSKFVGVSSINQYFIWVGVNKNARKSHLCCLGTYLVWRLKVMQYRLEPW